MTKATHKAKTDIADQLRAAVYECGKTRYQIALDSGIDQAALSKFMTGERGLRMATIEKLCAILNLELSYKS